jgi:hypothetical protein
MKMKDAKVIKKYGYVMAQVHYFQIKKKLFLKNNFQ